MNLPYNGLNMVIAGDSMSDHFFIQRAMLAANSNHRHSSVYSHTQLMDYLLKKGSYKNCPEPWPDCILLNFNQSSNDAEDLVRHIRYFPEFTGIAIVVLCKNNTAEEKEKTISHGDAVFYNVEQGYEPLAEFIQHQTANLKSKSEKPVNNRMAAA
jgi:hypothetical protein